jgi:hypothetical protein
MITVNDTEDGELLLADCWQENKLPAGGWAAGVSCTELLFLLFVIHQVNHAYSCCIFFVCRMFRSSEQAWHVGFHTRQQCVESGGQPVATNNCTLECFVYIAIWLL